VGQYTVIWWQAADDELLRLWLESPAERSRITNAALEIDKLLSARPENVGELVHEGLGALEVAPLRVQFSIESDDRIVRVWTVRLITQ
jgi:hypothetical protein